jgi:hypothetical protein
MRIQVFAAQDESVAAGGANSTLRNPSGNGNNPVLANGALSQTIPDLVYVGTGVFSIGAGTYLIQAVATLYYDAPNQSAQYYDSWLSLSTCTTSSGGGTIVDIAYGTNSRGAGATYLDTVYTFTSTTYLTLRHYGGNGGSAFGSQQGYNISLSFIGL